MNRVFPQRLTEYNHGYMLMLKETRVFSKYFLVLK